MQLSSSRVIWDSLKKVKHWEWRAIGLCFLVSTLAWLFSALNKTYTTWITYPIRFSCEQPNIVPLREPPKKVKLEVSGVGWSLLRRNLGMNIETLVIKITDPLKYKSLASVKLMENIASNLSDLKILNIQPDSLFFTYSRIIEKDVTVRLATDKLYLQKGYRLVSDIQIKPKIVTLRGADSLVRSAPDTLYVEADEDDINSDFQEKLQIIYPKHPYLACSTEKVTVSFKVAPYQELTRLMDLNFINFPKDSSVWVETRQVWVSYRLDNRIDTTQYKTDSLQLTIVFDRINWKDSIVVPRIEGISPYTDIQISPSQLKVYAKKDRNNRRNRNR